jgi:hypothetical protein
MKFRLPDVILGCEMTAREQAAKLARVEQSLPAVEKAQIKHGPSELDRLAAHRGKGNPSLRSVVSRRTV